MKKIGIYILTLAMVASSFAGCAQSSVTESGKSAPAAASTVDSKPVTIKVFHHYDEQTKRDALQKMMDQFTAQHPNVKFDVEAVSQSSFSSSLKTKIAAGDAPDIICDRPKMFQELVQSGQVLDITGASFLSNVPDSIIKSFETEGKVYGVPMDMGTMGVFYNKDIFTKEGLQVPKTPEEFIAVCKKLKADNITPFAQGFKDAWTSEVNFQSDFYTVLKDQPNFFADVQSRKKKFADYPELKKTFEREAALLPYGNTDPFSMDYATSISTFATGKAAMLVEGDWVIGELRKVAPKGNFGFFGNPNVGSDVVIPVNPGGIMISAQTKYKDQVLQFMGLVCSAQGGQTWSDGAQVMSVIKNVNQDKLDPVYKDILAYLNQSKVYNFESKDVFSGQYDSTFRTAQEQFAADKSYDADKIIKQLDAQFDKIKQTD